ncbi:hypothetical protein GCM10026982_60580 [Nocardiopsis aegyptia]
MKPRSLIKVIVAGALIGVSLGCSNQPPEEPVQHDPATHDPSPTHRLGPGTGISGRVTVNGSTPTAPCSLSVEGTSPWAPALQEYGVTTDDEGYFSWTLPEATYTVTAVCEEGSAELTDVVVTEGTVITTDLSVN